MKDEAIRRGNFVDLGGACCANLDQVRRYQYLDDERVRVWWANGDEEVLTVDGRIAPEHYFVVPATPGFELLMYWPLGGENWEEELQRSPVVAWRINEDHTDGRDVTETIIAISTANTTSAEKASNIRVGVRHPNGVVSHYADGRTWENEEMWLEWAKEDWREKREAAS